MLAASSDAFSARHTAVIFMRIWKWLVGSVDLRLFHRVHFLVRKSAHVTEYAIHSALCFRAVRGPVQGIWNARWMLLAIAAALAVALADEWHQAFVPSRTSSGWDVLLDLSAALLAQAVIWAALRKRAVSTF
ncbi:MAG: VanZ family protein [Acidobacteria bacterium]|nr:VanZ family protein [Acidobacteriota bacterium]